MRFWETRAIIMIRPWRGYDWFRPDALWDLIADHHITPKQAADCLVPQVGSVQEFVEQLIKNHPSKKTVIEQTYAKYKKK